MSALLLALTLATSAPEAPDPADGRTERRLILASAALDLAITEAALRDPGLREANPIGQSIGARAAMVAGGTAVVLLADRKLRADGHPRAARVARLAWLTARLVAIGRSVAAWRTR